MSEQTPATHISIATPDAVVASLRIVVDALPGGVVLVGGWAVRCRLRMARAAVRPTEDLDLLLRGDARPARDALAAVDAIQADPEHPCRLEGLPLLVDLLADDLPDGVDGARPGRVDERIEDPDGLVLLVPPFGLLLARSAELVRLVSEADADGCMVRLPSAGALFAGKVANVALDFRTPEKRASDGEDVVRLIEAFGALALLADLEEANSEERADLHDHLVRLGAGGLAGQARAARLDHDPDRLRMAISRMVDGLAS